ncbi:MAG: Unknown protein, partial [uncultured Aureispira sp.]
LGKGPINKGVRLVIDGSQMGSKHVALCFCLITGLGHVHQNSPMKKKVQEKGN